MIKMLVSSIVNEAIRKVFKFYFFIKKSYTLKKSIESKEVNKRLSFETFKKNLGKKGRLRLVRSVYNNLFAFYAFYEKSCYLCFLGI